MPASISPTHFDPRIAALLAHATAADGVPPISDGLLEAARAAASGAPGSAEPPALALGVYDDGELAGWAVAAWQGTRGAAELVVAPDRRGRGLGGALVAGVREALSGHPGPGLPAPDPTAPDGAAEPDAGLPPLAETWFWSHGDHPAAAHMAATLGYGRERELLQLHTDDLDAASLPAPAVPAGVELRAFSPGDEADWMRVNNAAFDWHPEQGGQTAADYAAMVAAPDFDPADVIFAVTGPDDSQPGRIIGFHETKLHADHPSGVLMGEVYVIGVDPRVHARGVGRALTVAGMRHMVERGARQIELYVESDNTPALRLYESLGFSHRIAHISYAPPSPGLPQSPAAQKVS